MISVYPGADGHRAFPAQHAATMLSSYTMLLAARRLIANHHAVRARAPEELGEAAWADIDRLELLREHWALESPSDQPAFWITAYFQMLRQHEEMRATMISELPEAGAGVAFASLDIAELDEQIAAYRRRLVHWQRMA